MITRRHIRVKVMQNLYAFNQAEQKSVEVQERFMLKSIDEMFDLFFTTISLLDEIRKEAHQYFQRTKKKRLASEADKNPNTKFIDNPVWSLLIGNPEVKDYQENRKANIWEAQPELVSHLWKKTRESELYKEYISTEETSFKTDKDFFADFFKEIVAPDDRLYDIFEETKITWLDDLPLVNTFLLKNIQKLKPGAESISVATSKGAKEEKEFAKQLFRKTVLNQDSLTDEFARKTPNWDKERIAAIDSALLAMAICEFLKFPSIPVKVTINEYLEIAKEYSTPKSSFFINGVLDKLSKDFKKDGRLIKTGRGLM